MAPIWRWAGRALAALAVLAVLAVGMVYVASELTISRHYPLPPSSFHVVADAGSVARGAHLVRVVGCTDCHGADLRGQYVDDFKMAPPNLTLLAKSFSDADFDRAIRHGLKPDGTSLAEYMPSGAFQYLSDRELSDVVAYIRSRPVGGQAQPAPSYSLAERFKFLTGENMTQVTVMGLQTPGLDLGPQYAVGRHLATIACGECHTTTFNGYPGFSPNLVLVASYGHDDFVKFMRTGKAAGNRELPLMSDTARLRFSQFSPGEVDAIYSYLAARGQKLNQEAN